jgi:hypothetical protein
MRFFTVEKGTLMHVPPYKQSGKWFIKTIQNDRLGSGAMLRTLDTRNFSKYVKLTQDEGQGCEGFQCAVEVD